MLASLDLPNISAAAYRLNSSTGDMSGGGKTKTVSVGNGNSNTAGHFSLEETLERETLEPKLYGAIY